MASAALKISFGTSAFRGAEAVKTCLQALAEGGVKEIDSAHIYANGQNESDLGNAGAGDGRFAISTKCAGGWRSGVALLPENLYRDAHQSLENLKVKQLDIFYIHAPDRTLKLEDWVPTIHKLYEEGVFKRFGVSNFSPKEVEELHAYSEENNFVQATVYQGNYSAIARNPEKVLFPTLRSRNIAFYAYSPLAGGFLTKTREQLLEGVGNGRWAKNSPMAMYRDMYIKPSYLEALDQWHKLSEQEGCSQALLAYRWISYHSPLKPEYGDTVILGASKIEQIQTSVEGLKQGPLKSETVKAIEDIWKLVEKDAPVDNYDALISSRS